MWVYKYNEVKNIDYVGYNIPTQSIKSTMSDPTVIVIVTSLVIAIITNSITKSITNSINNTIGILNMTLGNSYPIFIKTIMCTYNSSQQRNFIAHAFDAAHVHLLYL